MNAIALIFVACGLAADAFAAALTQGVKMRRFSLGWAAAIALVFGFFQGLMPVLGWALAAQFSRFLAPIDHWVAFGLLGAIGLMMIREAFSADAGPAEEESDHPSVKALILLGIGTSIDAAAVGVSFAMLDVNIWKAAAIVGVVTCVLSFSAVAIGRSVGSKFRKPAEITGGLVLIGIGVRILVSHLFGV